jgi:hypothetical protein
LELGALITKLGRADIASAKGKFGKRWTDGFKASVSQGGGNYKVSVTHDVPYWRVFEYGATIKGKPLLWIPLSFATDAKGVRARDYPGQLFRVDRKNGKASLLLAAGKPAQPKYFGKEQVRIPRKFHLRTVITTATKQTRSIYRRIFKQEKA